MIPALPNRPRPRTIRKNFKASMVLSFLSYSWNGCHRGPCRNGLPQPGKPSAGLARALRGGGGAEKLGNLVGVFRDQEDAISHLHAGKQHLAVAIAEANATGRGVVANAIGAVGAVNAEALD